MRLVTTVFLAMLVAGPLDARAIHYRLDPAGSEVGFEITAQGAPLRGRMPVSGADLTLDFDRAAASRVRVRLDAGHAEMGLPFATDAMRSDQILATRRFPEIRFQSTAFRASGDSATVEGRLTIRDVTRPVALQARIFRPKGTAPGWRDDLIVRLTGSLSRAAFGATGFPGLVGDEVRLTIRAHILQD